MECCSLFLLIYLYYEVKGKSTNIISIGLNLLHKLVRVRLPDLLLWTSKLGVQY
ncbi:Hypothetical protein NCDO2118_1664 [Lactococcus lactis subsp. lactis NCDO 2118]|uniref:Uncharacterized protein n=1 Tax=Lactococcus lactis subsp. lactis NCDO 2118 TaxID=1117941 RepID=A0ABC8A6Z3_LACLL|nr:Hypothetical protein NCDO2118_1664 [Lactococcus lactis subsp. lactis NCDO 2118]